MQCEPQGMEMSELAAQAAAMSKHLPGHTWGPKGCQQPLSRAWAGDCCLWGPSGCKWEGEGTDGWGTRMPGLRCCTLAWLLMACACAGA